jgi:hypothetical protein
MLGTPTSRSRTCTLFCHGECDGGATNPDAIRMVGSGSYLVAHNIINCGWTDGTATGINVIGRRALMAPRLRTPSSWITM